jgi:hypothetical protein
VQDNFKSQMERARANPQLGSVGSTTDLQQAMPTPKLSCKKYSGPLLTNAAKLKDIRDLLHYMEAENHPFFKNLRADNEAKNHLILRSLITFFQEIRIYF